jgi:hypothetical protein
MADEDLFLSGIIGESLKVNLKGFAAIGGTINLSRGAEMYLGQSGCLIPPISQHPPLPVFEPVGKYYLRQ